MKTMHLFAGAGGGLLADLILGHTPIVAVEIKHERADNLCKLRDSGWFPEITVENCDIRSFNGAGWSGKVDMVHAGIPCPRWSTARHGVGEPDNYWPEVFRIVKETKPKLVFIESVSGIQKEHCIFERDLSTIGFHLSPGIITTASSVGAPHFRERYWSLAYTDENCESMRPKYDEASVLPKNFGVGWWETNPTVLRMDDGVADKFHRKRLEECGDGQVPLQAATAFNILYNMVFSETGTGK